MKVLHINTKYEGGGAARAMQRLHDQLESKGHASRFVVGRPDQADPPRVEFMGEVVERHGTVWDGLLSRMGNRFEDYWGIHPWARRPTLKFPETEILQWADLIDLRNLFGDYFNLWSLPELSGKKPVVWRLPDMWALTGHCAYPYDCQRWISGCHNCPLLSEQGRKFVEPLPTKLDGTRRVWRAKKRVYQASKLHLIVTTRWMKENLQQGILQDALSIHVISNGVDVGQFRPYPAADARREFDLPQDQPIALFAAASLSNRRKGFNEAARAMRILQDRMSEPPLLITMGNTKGITGGRGGDSVRHFGFVGDPEQQAKLYAAADLFLCTTLADAQPQTALESIACGTPIVAFNVGPMPDIVGGESHGWISPALTPPSLADTIEHALSDPRRLDEVGERCRKKAEQDFSLDVQTDQYIALYESLLSSN